MIRKKELIEKFGFLVQQEIINHNKEILASNVLMNQVIERLDRWEAKLERETRDLHHEMMLLQQHVKCLNISWQDQCDSRDILEKSIHQRDQKNQESSDEIKDRIKEISKDVDEAGQERKDLYLETIRLRQAGDDHRKELRCHIEKLYGRFEKQLKLVSESFYLLPCKSQEEIDRHENQINEIAFSIRSFYEEMQNHKDKRFYNEKQIEHAYTLIERLSKKVES